jgi:AraC family transcriptional regulator of adaptative response/methylated-DNA-[protein]-cysteine methyltransferase
MNFLSKNSAVDTSLPVSENAGQRAAAILDYSTAQTDWGLALVAATTKGVCSIAFGDNSDLLSEQLQEKFPKASIRKGGPVFQEEILRPVLAFLKRPEGRLPIPLDLQGTAFQKRVWRSLQAVPPGETISYRALAVRLEQPKAARAVARACADNRLAVVIPCHRVVRGDGQLGGYRWGIERKRALLDWEKSAFLH